jgi:hypothetical protein
MPNPWEKYADAGSDFGPWQKYDGGAPELPGIKPPRVDMQEQPGMVDRFVSGVKEMVPSPAGIIEDYASRSKSRRAGAAVLGTKRGSPEEKTALDTWMNAPTSNPMGYTAPPGLEPVASMADKVVRGDLAGAAGNAVGVAGVAVATAGTLKYAPGVARTAAKGLKNSAAKNYKSILRPTSEQLVPKAEKTAAALAEQKPVALTRGGLQKQMKAQQEEFGPKASAAYNDKPPVDPTPILEAMEKIRQNKAVVKGTDVVVSDALNAAIEGNPSAHVPVLGLKDKLLAMRDANGMIPAAALDDIKDKLFRGSVDAFGTLRTTAPQTAKAIEQGVAGAIKGYLDELFPDAAQVNKAYSTAKTTDTFLERARRKEETAKAAILTGSAQGFGALAQRMLPRPIRQLPATIAGTFDSTAWNTTVGAGKSALADSLIGMTSANPNQFLFGDYRNPHYANRTTPPDAGAVPKGNPNGLSSAFDSAEVFAREMPPPFKSAAESAAVLRNAPEPPPPPMKSAAESAQVFAANPPQFPPFKSAADSADVFRRAEANQAIRGQKQIQVPQTGISESVMRAMDARERLSQQLTGKRWFELTNPERIRIDELIAEGSTGAGMIPLRPMPPPRP